MPEGRESSMHSGPRPAADRTAPLLGRRHVMIGGLLALASGVGWARQPRVHNPVIPAEQFEGWVPKRFGDWSVQGSSGVVLPPPDSLRDRLYDNLVTRRYQAPDQPTIMLLLTYNNRQDGVLQVHRPEVCYPVGGFTLSETTQFKLPVGERQIPANFFTAVGPNRTEQVAYFTRLGGAFPRSWIEQRVAVAEENLAGRIPDGFMMRVSLLGTDPEQAMEVLHGFSERFITASPSALQELVFG